MFESIKSSRRTLAHPIVGLSGLSALLRRVFPALGRRPPLGSVLERLGSLPLTAHASLVLVRLHKETLLLGITPQSITLLTKGPDEGISRTESLAPASIALREEPLLQEELPGR
jgi:flagellar biogenesis protein FliO